MSGSVFTPRVYQEEPRAVEPQPVRRDGPDKIGGMVGKLTYGADKGIAIDHYEKAIKLNPQSPVAHIEYANGLLMLFKDKEIAKATKLYEKAAAMTGRDAMEMLDIEIAKMELADE